MRIVHVLFVTLTAIVVMTTFTYVYSTIRRRRFKQPPLLNELLVRIGIIRARALSYHPAGWIIHYSVGLLFITVFEFVRQRTILQPTFTVLLLVGSLCGLIGGLGWFLTSRLHPAPPSEIRSGEFYVQIFIAHILFGVGAYAGYVLLP